MALGKRRHGHNMGGFRGHSEHGAGRSMDGLDQDDPATGRGFFFDLGLSTLSPSTFFPPPQ